MKQIEISRRIFVLIIVVMVLGITGWMAYAKAIPESVVVSILLTMVSILPTLVQTMAGVTGTPPANGTGTGSTSTPTATTIPPKSNGNAALLLALPLPAMLLGGLLSCTAQQAQTGAHLLTVSSDVCVAIAKSKGRDDLATLCTLTHDGAEVLDRATEPGAADAGTHD